MTESVIVSEVVDDLLSLQELDGAIARSRVELQELDEEARLLEESLEALRRRESEAEVRVDGADRQLRQAERTVQAGRATVKRLQERAQEVINQRAHLAARTEMDAARQNLDAAETAMLEAMQEQEKYRAARQAIVDELAQAEAAAQERLTEIERRKTELEDEVAIQGDRRENRALRIDDSVRALYDRVRTGRTTSALAPVIDGVCGHCFTSIPKQRQAEIRGGRNLIVCETCGVILHADR
ncbi:MAG: C4-type zinc ribbon domain-containing protein [marine benthic group bacterium]|nr:C4-type zinc ribbon domain-containing protein [Gemmatimonadota bacterium]MCL7962081.1 C4-type zinc ribbon domain-containing protein [Candidatus Carthagonibacter metallireducens]